VDGFSLAVAEHLYFDVVAGWVVALNEDTGVFEESLAARFDHAEAFLDFANCVTSHKAHASAATGCFFVSVE
jgi:hypothetical protein